ncbi:unnamed protein product [Triticum turgidum subsp. durum]|uniref:Zinc finger PHD-type domain-containing protein n=1 Tax=Triticum turgidum subsp. durum TaxID=4567 RepID=A0A9R0XE95_TRITD|nr:unnamed protein product [Triticum turgidum subsp. durum]
MPTTPDIVLEGDGGGGGGDKPEEDAQAAGDDVAARETVGVANDSDPADEKPEEGAGAGLQSNEVGAAAVDDPADLGASLADVGSDQTGQGIHDGAGEADQFGLGAQDDAPLIVDSDIAVSDYGVDAHDEEGAPMDVVAAAELIDREAELVKEDHDVAEEGTEVDTHPTTGNDDGEEAVAAADDASTDEGRQMDAVSISRDVDEEKAAGAVGVNATGEDIQVDAVDPTVVDNQEKEISSPGDDSAGEKGTAGVEGEKDVMAAQNVAEESDRVPEEAELDMIDNVVAEEVTEMDILASTGNGNEDEGVVTAGDASADEGTSMDAVSISRDVNEEKCTDAAGVGSTDEDMQVDEGDEQEKEAGDDGADEEGVEKHAVTMTGEDEEDDMAEQNIAEEADSVPEEAEVDLAGDVPEEEDVQIYEDDDDDEPPPLARRGVGRPKRGRASSKAQAVVKPSVKRKDEEEVCFICFDGGELVICDRRFCPKAYHPSCINRDDDFFKSKGQWTCGGTFVATVRNLLAKCVTHVPSRYVKCALKIQTSSLSEELKASVRHA